jgi:hypothetical protein
MMINGSNNMNARRIVIVLFALLTASYKGSPAAQEPLIPLWVDDTSGYFLPVVVTTLTPGLVAILSNVKYGDSGSVEN